MWSPDQVQKEARSRQNHQKQAEENVHVLMRILDYWRFWELLDFYTAVILLSAVWEKSVPLDLFVSTSDSIHTHARARLFPSLSEEITLTDSFPVDLQWP